MCVLNKERPAPSPTLRRTRNRLQSPMYRSTNSPVFTRLSSLRKRQTRIWKRRRTEVMNDEVEDAGRSALAMAWYVKLTRDRLVFIAFFGRVGVESHTWQTRGCLVLRCRRA